jgi:hypothetical protein
MAIVNFLLAQTSTTPHIAAPKMKVKASILWGISNMIDVQKFTPSIKLCDLIK